MYVCTYMCVCVNIYIYIYIYTHTHTYKYTYTYTYQKTYLTHTGYIHTYICASILITYMHTRIQGRSPVRFKADAYIHT